MSFLSRFSWISWYFYNFNVFPNINFCPLLLMEVFSERIQPPLAMNPPRTTAMLQELYNSMLQPMAHRETTLVQRERRARFHGAHSALREREIREREKSQNTIAIALNISFFRRMLNFHLPPPGVQPTYSLAAFIIDSIYSKPSLLWSRNSTTHSKASGTLNLLPYFCSKKTNYLRRGARYGLHQVSSVSAIKVMFCCWHLASIKK